MSTSSSAHIRFSIALLATLVVCVACPSRADDATLLPSEEAFKNDDAVWRELLRKGDFSALEKIGNELRTTRSRYRNGRQRLWRYVFSILTENPNEMTKEDFARAFKQLEGWLEVHPRSVNARLMKATLWSHYGWTVRGGRTVDQTTPEQLETFADASAKASATLDEIANITNDFDVGYRRIRIEVSKGLGLKPDLELVYDGLKEDPRCLELVTSMSSCLLLRWFGEEGELEAFADEVARRTNADCGDMLYAEVAVSIMGYFGDGTLDAHPLKWKRIQQGFRDFERLYPQAQEHPPDEAMLAYMAGDLDAVYGVLKRLEGQPVSRKWAAADVSFDSFKQRLRPELMQGGHKQRLLGHTRPVMFAETLGDTTNLVTVNNGSVVRLYDIATGEHRGWTKSMSWIRSDSISFHRSSGFLAAGRTDGPGVTVFSLDSGKAANLLPSEIKVWRTAFSPKGDYLATADEQGLVTVFDLETGKSMNSFPSETKRQVIGLSFSADALRLAGSCSSGDLLIFDLEHDKLEKTLSLSKNSLRTVTWSSPWVAVGTQVGEVFVLDAASWATRFTWKTGKLDVCSLAFSLDNEKLAIGLRARHRDNPVPTALHVWSFQKDAIPLELKGHKLGVTCVRFTDDGKTLISASNDWTIRTWDVP